MIQESLTNVCKHSRRRRARLTLGYDRRELRITVEDLGPGNAPPPVTAPATGRRWRDGGRCVAGPGAGPGADQLPGGGHGIVGMRERVLALGGQFTAGPRPAAGSGSTRPSPISRPLRAGRREPPCRVDGPAPLDGADQHGLLTMEPLP